MKRFAACKVLRKDLERLPFPQLSASERRNGAAREDDRFEKRIFDKFGLTSEECGLIVRSLQ
jgi:hypothetical protein